MIEPLIWEPNKLKILDQRLIPHEVVYFEAKSKQDCIKAISDMITRGAPCIGFTAIWAMAFGCLESKEMNLVTLEQLATEVKLARPTAVNLMYEVDRCVQLIKKSLNNEPQIIFQTLVEFALSEIKASDNRHRIMANLAIDFCLIKWPKKQKLKVLTHCNTGYLACGSLGTALGFISEAHKKGLIEHVYADETRPYLQGSRLTAFELDSESIPHEIVVEGAWSYLFSQGLVDLVVVGADRIAKNGDTANKIGTSSLAIVAKYFNIPVWVFAPKSSFDLSIENGKEIEIEKRPYDEIVNFKNHRIAPLKTKALNPSFDITDHTLMERIFCEKGMVNPSQGGHLSEVLNG